MTPLKNIIRKNKFLDFLFIVLSSFFLLFSLLMLTLLILDLAVTGLPRISWAFLFSFPSRFADKAGILSAWVGTTCVMGVTALTAIPLGIASGIYLEEYAQKNWMMHLIEINISNLASVPSIVFGLMALGIFVYTLGLGHSILSAGLTLGLLILPIVICTTREAI